MSRGPSTAREPCPDRIVEDAGMGFAVGLIGGSIFHYIKGAINSPNGHRMVGGLETVRLNTPRTAGSFAAWGAMFSACDCAFTHARRKEDPWNSILAGAFTNGFFRVRGGLRAALFGSLTGGAFLAGIVGLEIVTQRMVSEAALHQQMPPLQNHANS